MGQPLPGRPVHPQGCLKSLLCLAQGLQQPAQPDPADNNLLHNGRVQTLDNGRFKPWTMLLALQIAHTADVQAFSSLHSQNLPVCQIAKLTHCCSDCGGISRRRMSRCGTGCNSLPFMYIVYSKAHCNQLGPGLWHAIAVCMASLYGKRWLDRA